MATVASGVSASEVALEQHVLCDVGGTSQQSGEPNDDAESHMLSIADMGRLFIAFGQFILMNGMQHVKK
jgi:hypothetical protein